MGHFVMGPARRQNAAFGSYCEHRCDVDELPCAPRGAARSHHSLDGDRRPGCVLDVQRVLMRVDV